MRMGRVVNVIVFAPSRGSPADFFAQRSLRFLNPSDWKDWRGEYLASSLKSASRALAERGDILLPETADNHGSGRGPEGKKAACSPYPLQTRALSSTSSNQ